MLELAAPWYWGPSEARLGDERQDRAGDEVPGPAESQRDDRLDVEDVLHPLVRADAEGNVVLERDADHQDSTPERPAPSLRGGRDPRCLMSAAGERAGRSETRPATPCEAGGWLEVGVRRERSSPSGGPGGFEPDRRWRSWWRNLPTGHAVRHESHAARCSSVGRRVHSRRHPSTRAGLGRGDDLETEGP